MIPKRDTLEVDSTVQGEAVAMSVDTSALAHIMNVLTDLYSDPELAIIREYSTNALDSHIQAGVSRPIEVMTPTALRPLFTVRDYGTGLDAADIREIYSRYGASTKRGTNDAVGMLGLGCKSALAYVDQFTLIGIRDGDRVAVSVSRDESGAGTMTVLESGATDEPDGVEISIPAKRANELARKAADFFSFWAPGTVLLDGDEPDPMEGFAVGDAFHIVERGVGYVARQSGRQTPAFQVVMGNVAYPAPSDYSHAVLEALPNARGIVARVPIGHVSFVPSREGLQDAPATRRALDETLDAFDAALQRTMAAEIENAADRPAAAKALIAARESLGSLVKATKWKGSAIPDKFGFNEIKTPEGSESKWQHSIWHCYPHAHPYRRQSERMGVSSGVRLELATKAVWLLDYDNASWSASQRRKLDAYLEAHGISETGGGEDVLQTDADRVPNADWLDSTRTVSWTDVKAWRDPAKSAEVGGRTYAGTYSVHGWQGRSYADGIPAEQIAEDGRPVYVYGDGKWYERASEAQEILGDCLIVATPSTRVAKFRRMFPNAVPVHEAVESKAAEWIKGLTPTQRKALASVNQRGREIAELAKLDAAKLSDPDLKTAVKVAQAWTPTLAGEWRMYATWVRSPAASEAIPSLDTERYPLLASLLTSSASALYFDHVTMYCNAAFDAATTKGNRSK